MATKTLTSEYASQTLLDGSPTHAAPPEVGSLWGNVKSFIWGSKSDAPTAGTNFVGEGHRLGGTDATESVVDKQSMMEARLKAFDRKTTTKETSFEPPNHRTAVPMRSCLKGEPGSRSAARIAEIKAQGVLWDNEESLPDQPDWNSIEYYDRRTRATIADQAEQRKMRRMNLKRQNRELDQLLDNDILDWVPTSNFTLDNSKGEFDTLHKYGANWEDEGSVAPEDLETWRAEMNKRVASKYMTFEELKSLWPDTLGSTGCRDDVIPRGKDASYAWVTDHKHMVEGGFKLLCTTEEARDSYLGVENGVRIPQMEELKRVMNKMNSEKKRRAAQRSLVSTERQRTEMYRVEENDFKYLSHLKTALDDLEQCLNESSAATDSATADGTNKDAWKTYLGKLRGKEHLVPIELDILYDALKMGTTYAKVMETLSEDFDRCHPTAGSDEDIEEEKSKFNHRALSEDDKTRVARWMTQTNAMLKREQKLVLPFTKDGNISYAMDGFEEGLLERGRDLMSRLKSLKNAENTSRSSPGDSASSNSMRYAQSWDFDDDPFMRSESSETV